ncbi:MAG: Ig-like domain-containing protein, partial [Cyclobacteriaceae bacterium]
MNIKSFPFFISLGMAAILSCQAVSAYTYVADKNLFQDQEIRISENTIEENAAPEARIGTLSAPGPYDFSLSEKEDNAAFLIDGNKLLASRSFNFEEEEELEVEVVATHKNNGTQYSQELEIRVLDVNEAPVIRGQKTNFSIKAGSTVSLTLDDLEAEDEDEDDEYPEGFSLQILEGENYSVDADQLRTAPDYSGELQVGVVVNDGELSSEPFNLSMQVEAENQAPVANDTTATTDENTAVTVSLAASDAEGDALTFLIVGDPANGSLSDVSGSEVTYTPDGGFSGADFFTFKANDGLVDSDTATVSITVNNTNEAPFVANPISDLTVEQDAADSLLDINNVFSDPDGDALTLSLSNDNTALLTATLEDDSSQLRLSFAAGASGTANISLTATDPDDLQVTESFTVTVNEPANTAPIANAGEDFSVTDADNNGSEEVTLD